MIQITRSGVLLQHNSDEVSGLKKQFDERFHVRFPKFLEPALLEEIHRAINAAVWSERVHDGIGVEHCLADQELTARINFLLNDEKLFHLMQEISGCEAVGSFSGRAYRMFPGSGHYDSWHSDVGDFRLVALTINLSKEIYNGGVLQIAPVKSEEPAEQISNTGFGDAILFRLGSNLKHRVTDLSGEIPKTAFAGWFKSQPNFFSMLSGRISSEAS
jgi:2OG-Fe(II) oxygenase superfamily